MQTYMSQMIGMSKRSRNRRYNSSLSSSSSVACGSSTWRKLPMTGPIHAMGKPSSLESPSRSFLFL